MISRVIELSNKTAAQIMVPRNRIVWVAAKASLPQFLEVARKANFTRLPVYDEERKVFVGIVNMFEVLSSPGESATVTELMRMPLFVPVTTPLTEILPRLRLSKQPMCLVTDAQSEIVGLLTTQDLLKEIVGQL